MEDEKQEYGKFQWFFFVILIPIIFTITLVVIILNVAGFDVLGNTKSVLAEVPVIEKFFNDKEQETKVNEAAEARNTVKQNEEKKELEQTIEEQTSMIKALEQDVTTKENEIQKLSQEIKSLESQLEDIKKSNAEKKTKDITKLYDNMSSKKAAELIPRLKEADAILILTSLDDRQVADILSKMPVDDAVKYTNLLSAN
jgi:flagellar protein FlbB